METRSRINIKIDHTPSMLKSLFKKKPKEKQPPTLQDLDGNPIQPGDRIESFRYDLGECTVELDGLEYFYQSIEKEDRVSYTRMIDAITGFQKVRKKDA